MSQVDQLLSEYKEAHRAGSGDPRPFLSRAPAEDRALLAALIEGYLEQAPRRELEPRRAARLRGRAGGGGNPAVAGGSLGTVAGAAASPARAGAHQASRSGARAGGAAGSGVTAGQGGRLLPPDGAGAAARRRSVGHGARRARQDRGGGGRVAAKGRVAARAGALAHGRGGGVHAHEPAPRTCRGAHRRWPPRSGTRSTAFSAAAESAAARERPAPCPT